LIRISWLSGLLIILLLSVLIFPVVIVYLTFSGHLALAAGFFVSGLFWFPLLLVIIVALGMWTIWKHLPLWLQVIASALLLVIGLALTDVLIGIPFDVLAILGFVLTVVDKVTPNNRRLLRGR
jgi:hypothetical protein